MLSVFNGITLQIFQLYIESRTKNICLYFGNLKVYPAIKCRYVLTDNIHLIHQDVIRSTVFLRANIFLSVLRLIYYVFYVKNIFSRSMCVNVCKRQMFHTSCVLCSASSKVLLKLFCLIYIQSATYYWIIVTFLWN